MRRFRLGASGAERLWPSAPSGAFGRPLNFTVRRRRGQAGAIVRPLGSGIRCSEPRIRRLRSRWRFGSPCQERLAPAPGCQGLVAVVLCRSIWRHTGRCGYRVSQGAFVAAAVTGVS